MDGLIDYLKIAVAHGLAIFFPVINKLTTKHFKLSLKMADRNLFFKKLGGLFIVDLFVVRSCCCSCEVVSVNVSTKLSAKRLIFLLFTTSKKYSYSYSKVVVFVIGRFCNQIIIECQVEMPDIKPNPRI